MSRAFGGGCALPDGTLIFFGGWHLHGITFDDVWAAYVGDKVTDFFAKLMAVGDSDEAEGIYPSEGTGMLDPRIRMLMSRPRRTIEFQQLLGHLRVLRRSVADSEEENEQEHEEDNEEEVFDSSDEADNGSASEAMGNLLDAMDEGSESES